ncbi:hypothetical protein FB45DRAFT_1081441 [Roridomyces roridus]|uniref:MYND-type domain-containing protein n=1 Tax=Roridomyces roridus TaxID=1738132 RepID=A0AAD7F937_9AGAR|nr:hypothetical protein FB45DRAFT_1081441 [Roridomyces roridus]
MPSTLSKNTPGIPPDLELAFSDPLAWEQRWEQVFAAIGGRRAARVLGLRHEENVVHKVAISPYMQDPKNRHTVIHDVRSMQKALCTLQAQMTDDDISLPVVQERWMSASPTRRGEIILAGLVAACTTIPTLNDARCLCAKEMSVKSHRQNARLFLDLLEEMRASNSTEAEEPPTRDAHRTRRKPFDGRPYTVWDAIVADQKSPKTTVAAKTALAKILAERNMLIGSVVNSALRSILDLPPLQLCKAKNASKPRISPDIVQSSLDRVRSVGGEKAAQEFGKVARQIEKGVHARSKEIHAAGKQMCHSCKKFNETTTKFPRCKRCWDTLEKSIVYCSTECQKIDWKAGHQKECGKLLQLEDLTL